MKPVELNNASLRKAIEAAYNSARAGEAGHVDEIVICAAIRAYVKAERERKAMDRLGRNHPDILRGG